MTDYNETPRHRGTAPGNQPQPRQRRTPLGIVDHHIVGTLPGCTAHFANPSTGYATNYGIGSGNGRGEGGWWIDEYVPAEYVAWGNGNGFLNTYGISIEHENNLAIAINGKPRPEVHELSARFHAALAVRFNWRIGGVLKLVARDFPNHDYYGRSVPGFGTEFNVITHRSVALKDCPKDLDVGWIVDRGNQIIREGINPDDLTIRRRSDMGLKRDTTGTVYWQGGAGRAHIGDVLARDLMVRHQTDEANPPKTADDIPVYNGLQLNIINNVLVASNTADDDARARIEAKVDELAGQLDEAFADEVGADSAE